ncbi:unnamed protein product, partial [Pylaiella littoralis]
MCQSMAKAKRSKLSGGISTRFRVFKRRKVRCTEVRGRSQFTGNLPPFRGEHLPMSDVMIQRFRCVPIVEGGKCRQFIAQSAGKVKPVVAKTVAKLEPDTSHDL